MIPIIYKYPKLVEKVLQSPYRGILSDNMNATHILENNTDMIDWIGLSSNINAIHILKKNLDKVDWNYLSRNINAIHILEQNLDKISWKGCN
jgi:hypothetical protein